MREKKWPCQVLFNSKKNLNVISCLTISYRPSRSMKKSSPGCPIYSVARTSYMSILSAGIYYTRNPRRFGLTFSSFCIDALSTFLAFDCIKMFNGSRISRRIVWPFFIIVIESEKT